MTTTKDRLRDIEVEMSMSTIQSNDERYHGKVGLQIIDSHTREVVLRAYVDPAEMWRILSGSVRPVSGKTSL